MKIIFGFSRPQKELPLSVLIRQVEKRLFSHAYMRLMDPIGLEVVFQASGLAVNLMSLTNFKAMEIIVEEYELEITDDQYQELWTYIISRLGVSYSILQLFSLLLYKLIGVKVYDNGETGEICSELAARTCTFLGKPVPGDLDYETPSDFREFCTNNLDKLTLSQI